MANSGKSKAYELIAEEPTIRAYKMGGRP